MVKNTQGGSSHKKFGRKHTTGSSNNRLRVSEAEGELFAIATKMLGNGMFHCLCVDNVTRLCHIRGKFSGRGKRDNAVVSGKWVLIGLREWDITTEHTKSNQSLTSKKYQQCDLLEVYGDMDKQRLKETVSVDWAILDSGDVSRDTFKKSSTAYDDNIVFGTEQDFDREKLIQEMNSVTAERILLRATDAENEFEEEINIDDI
jgi:initiation factor 1A